MVENKVLNQIMLELKSINFKIDNLEKTTIKKDDFEKVVSNLATKEEISKLATKEEMYKLFEQNRQEMYTLVDKSTKEIASEIRELSKNISKKMNKQHNELINEIRRVETLNNNEHRIYDAQIRALQEANKYMQTKINKKALA